MEQSKIDINELKIGVQEYLDNNLEQVVYQDAAPIILYQKSIEPLDVDLLDNLEPTFSQVLFKFIKQKGISETDCYKNANLDRRLFSKIRSNDDYQPRKSTVFALIIGLKLNLEEAEELLDSAGFSISHSLKADVIIEYLIKKQIYDIVVVNEILYSFDCGMLGAK